MHLLLVANIVTTSKALVTTSVALVTTWHICRFLRVQLCLFTRPECVGLISVCILQDADRIFVMSYYLQDSHAMWDRFSRVFFSRSLLFATGFANHLESVFYTLVLFNRGHSPDLVHYISCSCEPIHFQRKLQQSVPPLQ